MACSILILLWVKHELSYDQFHQNSERIYRITAELVNMDVKAAVSPAPLGPAYQKETPEVESMVRVINGDNDLFQVDDRMFEERRVWFADSNFFQFFTFKFKQGDPRTALSKPESVVITESMAKKYFGTVDVLGKVLRKNHAEDFEVTAVIEDLPENTHLQFDFLQPMSFIARTNRDLKENKWDNYNFYTYLKLNDKIENTPATLISLESKMNELYKANEKFLKVVFHLQSVHDIHLRSKLLADLPGGGDIQYVYIFIVVGIFILVVACINFMNLATARSARRAKEVGLRKVAGAVRFQLIRQFLAESSVIAFISLALAVMLVLASLPGFNNLAGKNLSFDFLNLPLLLSVLGITLLTGVLAGSYPALFLSGFVPAAVLKGNLKAGAGSSIFRNTMVVVQFSVSIMLLVGTAVIFNQLDFIHHRNVGFDKENLVYSRMSGDLWKKYETLRNDLEKNNLTHNYTFVSDLPTYLQNGTVNVVWEGKDPESQPLFVNMAIDENFFDVFGVTLLSGRGFSKEFKADTTNLIVNEKALKIMNMDAATAVGKPLSMWDRKGTIIGVVKDFNFKPIQKEIEPLILRLNTWGGIAVVKTQPTQTEAALKAMEDIFKTHNPEYPFSYAFIDQDLQNLYKAELRLRNLFTVFVVLAIFISCLGLYGLSAFLAERRTKEIGVRKVLGASVFNVVYLLSKTFTYPILIAMVVATPISWYAMNQWLESFAFHVDIHWSIFVLAFVAALLVAWLTVSYESFKAAVANPSKSLRDE
jgi:ABC-type antimicrobial peptide transport system permease subunit